LKAHHIIIIIISWAVSCDFCLPVLSFVVLSLHAARVLSSVFPLIDQEFEFVIVFELQHGELSAAQCIQPVQHGVV
jgi:hypothetical protein